MNVDNSDNILTDEGFEHFKTKYKNDIDNIIINITE